VYLPALGWSASAGAEERRGVGTIIGRASGGDANYGTSLRASASCHSNPIGVIAGSGYIVRELSLFPSRFA
jgi:hypothetical protein